MCKLSEGRGERRQRVGYREQSGPWDARGSAESGCKAHSAGLLGSPSRVILPAVERVAKEALRLL